MSRYETESANAAFSGYEGLVFDAFFVEGEYGVTLNMKVQLDHPELFPQIEGGLQTVYLPAGRGWSVRGDGTEIFADGAKKIRADVPYGILLKRLSQGQMENMAELEAAHDAVNFSPTNAAGWKGLRFRFDEVEYPTRRPKVDAAGVRVQKDGKDVWEEGVAVRVMPTAFLGVKGGATNGKVTAVDIASLELSDDDAAFVSNTIPDSTGYDNFSATVLAAGKAPLLMKINKDVYAGLKATF